MRKPHPVMKHCSSDSDSDIDRENGESGYMLIAVLVLAALILIALSVAAPKMAVELQRDKETELFHRGMQYALGIRRYYKRFGAYPNTLDQLEKTNQVRFLRKRYKDPITGKDEWKLIRYGQAQTTGAGLNRQAGGTGAGAVGSSSDNSTGGNGTSGNNSAFGNSGGGSFGNSGGSGNSGSSFGNSGSSFGNSGSSFGNNGSSFGNSGSGPGSGTQASSGGTDPSGTSSSTGGTGTGSSIAGASSIGGSSTTFGGGQIIGVSSTSPKQSIREFKKQTHYNQWEFVYDPNQDNRGGTGTGISAPPGTSVVPPQNGFGGQPQTPATNQPAPVSQ